MPRRNPFNGWDGFIEDAILILGRHVSVGDACREMTEAVGVVITPGSLKEALRFRHYKTPSAYLRQNVYWQKERPFHEREHKPQVFETPEPAPRPEQVIEDPTEPVGPLNPRMIDTRFEIMYQPLPEQWEGEERILVVNDFHAPWVDLEAYHICLNSEFAQNATMIIWLGDMLDCEQVSKHERTTDEPLRQHYNFYCERIIKPGLTLPKVKRGILVAGNHDNWTRRYRGRRIIPDMYFMLQDQAGNDLTEVLGRTILDVPDPRLYYRFGEKNWWVRIGDAIFAHPAKYLAAGQKGRTGNTVWDRFGWFWKRQPDIRALVIGHTHGHHEEIATPAKYGSRRIWLAESCCFQNEEGAAYTQSGRSNYDPFQVGWAEVVQVNGVTDPERSRVVALKTIA